jgi:CHASE3 domain sensor protein
VDGGGGMRHEALRRRLYLTAIALGITLLWLLASTVVLTRETKAIRESAAQGRRLGEAQTQLQNVFIFLGDAETGQRGYLLTAKDRYLAPYGSALSGIAGLLDRLERSTVDVPVHAALLKDIRTQTDLKLAELAETIRLMRAGDRAAAVALVKIDRGQKSMEQLRADIADFSATGVRAGSCSNGSPPRTAA